MQRRFCQVDVFGSESYTGNPVAVVLDAGGLESAQMQQFARWTNLSETTFVLPPEAAGADLRTRIFTPTTELPFAGHPTLGTCHAWLEAGGTPRNAGTMVQECGIGLVRVRPDGDGMAFAAPPLLRSGPVDDHLLSRIAGMLGIERSAIVDAQWVDNGPGWVGVLLESSQAVLALRPGVVDMDIGVVGSHPSEADAAFEVRAFFPLAGGTAEDPVTGSLNASLAGWLTASGRVVLPYIARQGTALGRAGRVRLSSDGEGTIWTGGHTVTCIRGEVLL